MPNKTERKRILEELERAVLIEHAMVLIPRTYALDAG
jgi:hypothetical protein